MAGRPAMTSPRALPGRLPESETLIAERSQDAQRFRSANRH
jgi:hypothetical protein